MIDNQRQISQLRETWLVRANEIGFEIITPYTLDYDGRSLEVFAFLPQFGSADGMILNVTFAPRYETSTQIIEMCKRLGIYYSFLDYDSYISATKQDICEALMDWGYFGSPENKPVCMDR